MDSARIAVRSVVRRGDVRALADVGRHGRLELTFGYRGGRTVLDDSYAEPPFRIGRALRRNDGLHLILASSAPGVFGGDCLQQAIVVESGARVRLTSQSATQLHANQVGAPATLASTYRVESGAHLHCEWDPLIPFPDARFDQRIHIDLAEDATLLWSDALMAGREARGERWQFAHLSHELRVSRAGALVYMERYSIVPGKSDPTHRWTADGASYFGTTIAVGPRMNRDVARRLHDQLGSRPGMCASADLLDENLLLARLVSADGTAFHQARALVAGEITSSKAQSPKPS
jgi:urease accessory protein